MGLSAILAVFLGGALGSVSRWGLSVVWKSSFPWSTLTANLVGCLLIGIVLSPLWMRLGLHADWERFLVVGFCGGLTTFSTFAFQAVTLTSSGKPGLAVGYVTLSVVTGILAALVGWRLGSFVAG